MPTIKNPGIYRVIRFSCGKAALMTYLLLETKEIFSKNDDAMKEILMFEKEICCTQHWLLEGA